MEESHIKEYRQAKEEAKQVNESESQTGSSSDAGYAQEAASQSQPTGDKRSFIYNTKDTE